MMAQVKGIKALPWWSPLQLIPWRMRTSYIGRSNGFHHAAIVCHDIPPSEWLLLVRSLIVRIIGLWNFSCNISFLFCVCVCYWKFSVCETIIIGRGNGDQEIPDMECHYKVPCKGSIWGVEGGLTGNWSSSPSWYKSVMERPMCVSGIRYRNRPMCVLGMGYRGGHCRCWG